jgi:uncharacterized protein (TIRG00374 family)
MTTPKPKPSGKRRWIYLLLGTVITLSFLAWAFRGISPNLVWQALRGARLEWLGFGLVTYLASFVVRAHRWGTLLGAYHDPGSFKIRQAAVFIGFAGNAVLPASAGEVVRVAVLHRSAGVPFGVALGSIFAERLLDAAVAFLFLLTPLLPGISSSRAGVGNLPIGWIGLFLALFCTSFLIAANYPDAIAGIAERLSRSIGLGKSSTRIGTGVRSLLGGLAALRHPQRGIVAVLESVVVWSLTALTYWAGLLAFGITAPGVMGAVFIQSLVALAIALPSSPGYLGPFEAAIRFGLGIYAVPPDTIIAYALTLRLLMFISLTSIGFGIAARMGLSGADFIKSSKPAP